MPHALILINPTHKENAAYIKALIATGIKDFQPGQHYQCQIKDSPTPVTVHLTHSMLAFDKPPNTRKPEKRDQDSQYFAVLENQLLGKGAYGRVRPVFGTWKLCEDHLSLKIKPIEAKKRALKTVDISRIQNYEIRRSQNQGLRLSVVQVKRIETTFNKEHTISGLVPHLSVKYPLIKTRNGIHFLMRALPGMSLDQVLKRLTDDPNYLTATQRLLLCRELLEALANQVHSVNIIHRDIKPENIIITGNFEVKIIDYGLSEIAPTWKKKGTPLYMAPEILDEKIIYADKTNDLFAMGIIFSELWGDQRRRRHQWRDKADLILENKNITFEKLFDGIKNLPVGEQKALEHIFIKMTRFDVKDRYTWEKDMEVIRAILLQRYQAISISHRQLQNKIKALQAQLPNYFKLDTSLRKVCDQEFIVAETLANIIELFPQQAAEIDLKTLALRPQKSNYFSEIYPEFTETLLNCVLRDPLPKDCPKTLKDSLQNIEEFYKKRTKKDFSAAESFLKDVYLILQLAALFKRLKFIEPLNLTDLYSQHLHVSSSKLLKSMSSWVLQYIYTQLSLYFSVLYLPRKIKLPILGVCKAATHPEEMDDERFTREFIFADKFIALYYYYEAYNANQLSSVLQYVYIESFVDAYPILLHRLKEALAQDLKTLLVKPSFYFFQKPEPDKRVIQIIQEAEDLLDHVQPGKQTQTLKEKILVICDKSKTESSIPQKHEGIFSFRSKKDPLPERIDKIKKEFHRP